MHKRYVALGDLHFGWDVVITPEGKKQRRPVHEPAAFRAVLKFIRVFAPHDIYLMGDMFDMRPVCRHELDRPKKMEGQRLVEAYQHGWKFFLEPLLETGSRVHWVDGNHEAWAAQLAERYPGVDGIIEPHRYLDFKKHGILYYPLGSILYVGKLALSHGSEFGASWINAAKRAVERFGSSIRIWHFHTYQAYSRETLKNRAYQTGAVIPCLCNRGPSYSPSHFNSWVHGFNYGYISSSGAFQDYTPIIWRNRFAAEGQEFSGV